MPLATAVRNYLKSPSNTPFFLFVGDGQYASAIELLTELELHKIKLSDYCKNDDKLPNIDSLFDTIKALNKKQLVLGLGEYLAFCGEPESTKCLLHLKDMNIGCSKVVLVLRGLATHVAKLQADPRFDKRHCCVIDNATCGLSFTLAPTSVGISALTGFKNILSKLEDGASGHIEGCADIRFGNPLFAVRVANNPYEIIKMSIPDFELPRDCGNDTQWSALLSEIKQTNCSFDAVLQKYGYTEPLEEHFYGRLTGDAFKAWLYFIALKQKPTARKNQYLQYVLNNTYNFEDFKANVLNLIIDIPHTDKHFTSFYDGRKALVEKFPESDIAGFVNNNRKDPSQSIYKLTDQTNIEREAIIVWVSKKQPVPQLKDIYPALASYLNPYEFHCDELSSLLTDYFNAYKRQKISGKLEDDFLAKVDELALTRPYNRLSTRNVIIDRLEKEGTYLFWLDALGVEYLAYISDLVRKRGLSIQIHIARAELPTITPMNRDFFDDWAGEKEKNEELDDTKHEYTGGDKTADKESPNHLAVELKIIAKVIEKAATKLESRQYKRFVIASDHGSSRLAVLRRKEEKYPTDTQGEHSGRCCKKFEPYDLPFATEENGYLVLADYGRFKGSRAANVEVHGGASLEEVVVPIIELKLKDERVSIKLVDDSVIVDSRTGIVVTLFANNRPTNISLAIKGKRYTALPTDEHHFKITIPDIKRAGEYQADVYIGDDLIGNVLIKAYGKSGKVNEGFDELF